MGISAATLPIGFHSTSPAFSVLSSPTRNADLCSHTTPKVSLFVRDQRIQKWRRNGRTSRRRGRLSCEYILFQIGIIFLLLYGFADWIYFLGIKSWKSSQVSYTSDMHNSFSMKCEDKNMVIWILKQIMRLYQTWNSTNTNLIICNVFHYFQGSRTVPEPSIRLKVTSYFPHSYYFISRTFKIYR